MNRTSGAGVVDPAGATSTLCCPRCAVPMSRFERSGVLVDQCPDCRGMFLDRGELERLVDAESGGWTGPHMRPPEPAALSLIRVGHGYRSEWGDAPGDDR